MKRIILLTTTAFFISCSFNSKSKAVIETVDSITIVDSSYIQKKPSSIKTSSGYSTDPNYQPTVSEKGEYHTIDNNAKQIQYQGSAEQKRDIDMINEYARTHPGF